jgi:hypothetical protein
VSKSPTWPSVNKSEETIALDLGALFHPLQVTTSSPIDEYYDHARELLLSVGRPEIEHNDMIMRLLVLELVSTAELYFRRVLSGVITICPLIAAAAAKRPLLLGAISYYKKPALGYALLDGVSLSGEGDVKRQTFNITGIDIKQNSSAHEALRDFERVCQLRHVIVHAKGEVGAKNVADLGVSVAVQSSLKISALSFQPLVVVTHNAVRAYNAFMFESILRSWLSSKYLSGVWKPTRRYLLHCSSCSFPRQMVVLEIPRQRTRDFVLRSSSADLLEGGGGAHGQVSETERPLSATPQDRKTEGSLIAVTMSSRGGMTRSVDAGTGDLSNECRQYRATHHRCCAAGASQLSRSLALTSMRCTNLPVAASLGYARRSARRVPARFGPYQLAASGSRSRHDSAGEGSPPRIDSSETATQRRRARPPFGMETMRRCCASTTCSNGSG